MEPEEITFQSLKEMTGGFSEERKLGAGGFGVVYMGMSKNGTKVAVKKLKDDVNNPELDDKKFQNEFNNLKMLRHKNIVSLIGYCYDTERVNTEHNGRIIVADKTYRAFCLEYMDNGSLQKYISDDLHTLDWQTRFKIIKGVCKGLKYIHDDLDMHIYHLDLKPDNILLDKEMVPKLADFGLSRIFGEDQTRITITTSGTLGYLPPEYLNRGEITNKFDIFSLGVVMIMVVAGPAGYSKYSDMASEEFVNHLQKKEEFVNQVHEKWRNILQETWSGSSLDMYCEQVKRCTRIALNCVETNRHKRPKIKDIIYELNGKGLCCCDQRMLHMVLFLHQFVTGHNKPNRNEEFVIGVSYPNGFGTTLVHDWKLTTSPDPNGTIIARAQGLHMQAGQTVDDAWYNTFNLVFQDERYSGSTLQVMGIMTKQIKGELSIVGGTGQFRRAKGTIEFEMLTDSTPEDSIKKLDIQVFCSRKYP